MLLNRYLLIKDDTVVNVIVYDGGGWNPPDGCHIIPEVEGVGIGWRFVDGQWTAPPPEEPVEEQSL